MLFNSVDYIIFFPAVAIIYYCIPHAFRRAWLLASSCFFSMMLATWFIVPLLASGLFVYAVALKLAQGTRHHRLYYCMGIVVPLAILALFEAADCSQPHIPISSCQLDNLFPVYPKLFRGEGWECY